MEKLPCFSNLDMFKKWDYLTGFCGKILDLQFVDDLRGWKPAYNHDPYKRLPLIKGPRQLMIAHDLHGLSWMILGK